MNTAISERLMLSTVKPISREPRSAASSGFMPSSRCRVMFSTTTMASSTTKPVEMVSAISERLSRLKPHRYITPKVPMSETGTATPGMNIVRTSRRKTKTTRITSAMAISSVRSTSLIEARIVPVRSIIGWRRMALGASALRRGMRALIRSTVSMMFAPGSR